MAASPSNSERAFAFRVSGYFAPTLAAWKKDFEQGKKSDEARFYQALKRLIEKQLTHPDHALSGKTALKELSPVRRVYLGNRYRVLYVASREKKVTVLLYVGIRRKGDKKHDAYEVMGKLLRKGVFDVELEELDLSRK